MSGVQVFAPQDPMDVLVKDLISLMSRTPASMSFLISPAATLSQRQMMPRREDSLDGPWLGRGVLQFVLNADTGYFLGEGFGDADLDENGAVVGFNRSDGLDFNPTSGHPPMS